MKETIWVYDDEEKFSSTWVDKLKKIKIIDEKFDPKVMVKEQFDETIQVLSQRQQSSYSNKLFSTGELEIDNAGIFFIDYDLFDPEKRAYITGEKVAYLARCFSNCGLIIGINKDIKKMGTYYFDLKMESHLSSYCDLNIGEGHLDLEGLWSENFTGFRPWSWPNIPNYLDLFRKKLKQIDIKQNICETIGFKELIQYFPLSIKEFLGDDPSKTTFENFAMESGNGISGREKGLPDEIIARVSIARISKWLECVILPGQNILVDAPHLVSRYPSLLMGEIEDINTWNNTTQLDRNILGLNKDKIGDQSFSDLWLSKPSWFWDKVSKNEKIDEVIDPWNKKMPIFRFCEDSSKFNKKEDTVEFNIETDSQYILRYITKPQFSKVNYQPKHRLLTKV